MSSTKKKSDLSIFSMTDVVHVVGAGLSGSMVALMLAKRGFQVCLHEKRKDFREEARLAQLARQKAMESAGTEGETFGLSKDSIKRSINLALSHRGQETLRAVGLLDDVMLQAIPMNQRVMHSESGGLSYQPYGTHGECIYSVGREVLNWKLLDQCDAHDGVTVLFESSFAGMGRDGIAQFEVIMVFSLFRFFIIFSSTVCFRIGRWPATHLQSRVHHGWSLELMEHTVEFERPC